MMTTLAQAPRDSCPCVGSSVLLSGGLPSLSLELLEHICAPLPLHDRLALASCCKGLWARPDLAASPALWGSLRLGPRQLVLPEKRCAAQAWLARRRAALRRLELCGAGVAGTLPTLLLSLGGCPLVELRLSGVLEECSSKLPPSANDALLSALSGLASLRELHAAGNGLSALPCQVSALSSLAHLDLSDNAFRGAGALRQLQHLSSLTALTLADCSLPALPRQLSALRVLVTLDVRGNEGALDAEGALQPLEPLAASLRHLGLSECNMARLPRQLSALSGLQSLDLGQSWGVGASAKDDESSFDPLLHLTALTRLDISECDLRSLPPQLASLGPTLRDLNLRSNWSLGRQGPAGFHPLQWLVGLTRLVLGHLPLVQLPPQLSALSVLEHLDVSGSQLDSASPATFHPLQHLTALRHLDLGGVDLTTPPPELSRLLQLTSLKLDGNDLGCVEEAGLAGLAVLGRLTALERLDIGWCCLEGVPAAVESMPALSDLLLSGNDLHAERAVSALGRATALRRLALANCMLRALPPQLGSMLLLTDLDLSGNQLGPGGLGPGGRGSEADGWGALGRLTALTRLDLRRCALRHAPDSLSALQRLEALDLSSNDFWEGGPRVMHALCACTALRDLALAECGLGSGNLPSQLSALRMLESLRLCSNRRLGASGFQAAPFALLRALPSLTFVDLAGTSLYDDAELSALSSLGVRARSG